MDEWTPNHFTLQAKLNPNGSGEPFYCVTTTLVTPIDHVEFEESDRIPEAAFLKAIRELYNLDDRQTIAMVSKIGPRGSTLPQVVASIAALRTKGFILRDDRSLPLEERHS